MPVLQHYYTSFVDPQTNEGGFRTKAASPGLRPSTLAALLKLLSYRIPPTLDERNAASHPVALRYSVLGPDESVLLCSQSCGSDENGRPGNFFAHSLVASPEEFGHAAPISFWRHELWQRSAPSGESTLPIWPRLDQRPSLDIEEVWRFLVHPPRRGWFPRLLSAVVRGTSRRRPIVILDTADNVARWVAAVTYALPSAYRPQLTFSTYHHDPYESPCLITGTTRDSWFRFMPQEFQQYFILNAETGQLSVEEPAPYAEFVAERFVPDRYVDELVPFLNFCARRGEGGGELDERLNTLASLYVVLGREASTTFHPADIEALRFALHGFERVPPGSDEDVSDLTLTIGSLRAALAASADVSLLADYRRGALLGRAHDPAFALYLRDDLDIVAALALRGSDQTAQEFIAMLVEVYSHDEVVRGANDMSYLATVADGARGSLETLASVWRALGQVVRRDPGGQPLLEATFAALDAAGGDPLAVPEPAAAALASLQAATDESGTALLTAAVDWRRRRQGVALEWVYYELVRDLPPAQRSRLRTAAEEALPDIQLYEVDRDLRAGAPTAALAILKAWLEHLRGHPGLQAEAVTRAVRWTWGQAAPPTRPAVARRILAESAIVGYLDAMWEATLVGAAFSDLRLHAPTVADLPLYTQYARHPSLPVETQGLIGVCMALSQGTFDENSVVQLNHRLSRLDEAGYREELNQLLPRYLSTDIGLDIYANVVRAAYVLHHQAIFWEAHWDLFGQLLTGDDATGLAGKLPFGLGRGKSGAQGVGLRARWLVGFLSFWFDRAIPLLGGQPYLVQQFFAGLPGALSAAQQGAAWSEVAESVARQAGGAGWYPCARALLSSRGAGHSRLRAK